MNLSDEELTEVEACSEVSAQQKDRDIEISAQMNEA